MYVKHFVWAPAHGRDSVMLGGSGDADDDYNKDLTEFCQGRGGGAREDITKICLPRFNFEALT